MLEVFGRERVSCPFFLRGHLKEDQGRLLFQHNIESSKTDMGLMYRLPLRWLLQASTCRRMEKCGDNIGNTVFDTFFFSLFLVTILHGVQVLRSI